MIFSILVILLVGIVAYFHYVQGFFSATLSAVFAIVAAAVAVGWHESFVEAFLAGRYADQANAMAVCVMFATVYIVLRVLVDKLIPGNVRLPLIVDKVGAGAMGVVAGLTAAGVVAFAAQSLPFAGPIAGYSRLPLTDEREGIVVPPVPGKQQFRDSKVYDELREDDFAGAQTGMLVPADAFVVGTVAHLSNGPLSGGRSLTDVHPDWLLELFGQRLGIEPGAKRSAMNRPGEQAVAVDHVVVLPGAPQRDGEIDNLRELKLDKRFSPQPGRSLVVVVATLGKSMSDDDFVARFSPASVRLVAGGKNYFCIGTLDAAGTLVVNKPDDYLLADLKAADAKASFAFEVDTAALSTNNLVVNNGVFLEVKRFAREALGGKQIEQRASVTGQDGLMRKPAMVVPGSKPAPAAPAPPPAAPAPTPADPPAAAPVEPADPAAAPPL